MCGNAILTGIMGYLADPHAHPLWHLVDGIIARDADVRAKQVDEHRAILRAIGERDGDAAAETMTSHLGAVSTRLFGRRCLSPAWLGLCAADKWLPKTH